MSFPQVKEALREPTRPLVEPVPELNGTKRPTILDVPAFQEVPELGMKGTNIHPPQLVEDLDSDNLRRKRGELVQPKPQYSIQTLAEQIKQGIHPEIGGRKVGFVPFKPPPKEGEKKAPWTEIIPLPRTPGADLYLPVAEGLVVTQMMAWKVPGTSEEGNELIEIYFLEWEKKYGVYTLIVDAETGQMYIFKNNQLQQINKRCSTKPIVGEEIMSVTPSAGLGFGTLIVDTPGSSAFRKATPPPAESTRKLKGEGV